MGSSSSFSEVLSTREYHRFLWDRWRGAGSGEVAEHGGLRQLHPGVIVSPSVRMASSSETQC